MKERMLEESDLPEVLRLTEQRMSNVQIASQMGVRPYDLERFRRRHGIASRANGGLTKGQQGARKDGRVFETQEDAAAFAAALNGQRF